MQLAIDFITSVGTSDKEQPFKLPLDIPVKTMDHIGKSELQTAMYSAIPKVWIWLANVANRIFLVACVAGKQAGPVPAAQLYTSTWFRKARGLVEQAGNPWFILSAEHGLLSPDTPVRSYDRTLNTMKAAERRAWAAIVTRQMETQLPNADEVVLFAGIRYRGHLMPWLQANYARVSVPMAGMAIGKQLLWMTHESTI